MHIHILGICGTFMAGLAILAKQQGHTVTGVDKGVYPPMSTQLAEQGIECYSGYDSQHLEPRPDCVIIGNALSRGNVEVEAILNQGIPYTSGAQWLAEHILPHYHVLAVAGTHGKTTTSSMLAWLLESAGLNPSFLIGGVPENFGVSARLTDGNYFVIEADEYDTAFFDKRAKFVHYHPRTLVINNLEFDHADIYPDLAAIQRQFHHLIRTVPSTGQVISDHHEDSVKAVLSQGCWSEQVTMRDKTTWSAQAKTPDCAEFDIVYKDTHQGTVNWGLLGEHNMFNALSAVVAAEHIGIKSGDSCQALAEFKNVKRRLELRGSHADIAVYDDFAHHPTAIKTTLAGLRQHVKEQRIIAILEPRSNTMKMGVHQQELVDALIEADQICIYQPEGLTWSLENLINQATTQIFTDIQVLINHVIDEVKPNDHVLVMSNGGFENIHQRLLEGIHTKYIKIVS